MDSVPQSYPRCNTTRMLFPYFIVSLPLEVATNVNLSFIKRWHTPVRNLKPLFNSLWNEKEFIFHRGSYNLQHQEILDSPCSKITRARHQSCRTPAFHLYNAK